MFITKEEYEVLKKKADDYDRMDTLHINHYDRLNFAHTELYNAYNKLYRENLDLKDKLTRQKERSAKAYRELENKYHGARNAKELCYDSYRKALKDKEKLEAEKSHLMNNVKRQTKCAEEWREQYLDAQARLVAINQDLETAGNENVSILSQNEELKNRVHELNKRCTWYSGELRRERELNRQLTDELENKAKFICRPFLKEHEEMKEDFKKVLMAIGADGPCIFAMDFLPYKFLTRMYAKWFVKDGD